MPRTTRSQPPDSSPRWTLRDTLRSINGGPGYHGSPSDHFDGRLFFNPGAPAGRSFREFLRWQWTRQRRPWPLWIENRAQPALPPELGLHELALTFINHITFLLQFRELNILTDPVYAQRVSPFRNTGPQRVRPPGLAFTDLPHVHVVLISHNHYDHLDIETLRRLGAVHDPIFITTLGNGAFLQQFGLRRIVELDWWGSTQVSAATVTLTPAQHWSSRRPRNRNRTLWGGFLVNSADLQVFFAGDTGYGPHFRQIRQRTAPTDLALLPIGAYEPRWFMSNQHMNPDDAVRAHLDLEATLSIGSHFGCFQLTDEGIDEPVLDLAVARERYGVTTQSFDVLETGETRRYSGQGTSFSRSSSATSAGPR